MYNTKHDKANQKKVSKQFLSSTSIRILFNIHPELAVFNCLEKALCLMREEQQCQHELLKLWLGSMVTLGKLMG